MSVGIAYTLQVFGQQYVKPSLAAIILSFEVVLAALAGAWLLSETFSVRGYIGASLIFAGIILSQVQLPGKSKAEKAA
jgi:drug/metabolite transporter (DMT)-like permease